ncbi:unnamed protein product [Spirodela intermedia]|uniref:Uncharacterized protein n=1 Tax=Spirodela intermedia TaxID=51605 RepID=A0A7I8ILR0_SPIIN|nr:unnamed protein product [Spirodela intermedia]CAA2618375.1 unnamed protein product [Spirodela intermedia]CAA6657041.1 unnamed protein product [Spirodela intermedia]CAA6658092.1 unnamed protein product [Spirodela intermedia]
MAAVEVVQVTCDILLEPYHSPSSPPQFPQNAEFPLTPFDVATYNCHICILYAFRPPMPDNAALREGLARALVYFPHLAGRFDSDEYGYPKVVLNNAGIRLKEAIAPSTLEEHLPFDPSASFLTLHPHPAEGVEVLLQVQLTRFSCGGLTLGITVHHRIADGSSLCHFLLTRAKLVQGRDVGTMPFFGWSSVCAPRIPARVEFDHLGVEFRPKSGATRPRRNVGINLSKMCNQSFHFSNEFIGKLKAIVNGGDPGRRVTTFLSVLTHIWKKMAFVRRLPDDEMTQVRLTVNGRPRIKPPLPPEYYGNLVLWAYPKLTVGEVLRSSYSHVAQVIREAIVKVDDGYFRSFMDFGEQLKGKGGAEIAVTLPEVGDFLNPNIEISSWLSLQFHQLDFGGGVPAAFLTPGLPVEGLMMLVPSCEEGGGVDLHLCLEKSQAATMRQVMHSLD